MTQYHVSPEDQPMQSRDVFVPEHAIDSATPLETPTPETAPSAGQTASPDAAESETSE